MEIGYGLPFIMRIAPRDRGNHIFLEPINFHQVARIHQTRF